MKLTGKCEIAFVEWRLNIYKKNWVDKPEENNGYNLYGHSAFNELSDSMKWGVYVDFAKSKGIIIDVQPIFNYDQNVYTDVREFLIYIVPLNIKVDMNDSKSEETRSEAQIKAIAAFDKMYNDLHKKIEAGENLKSRQ